MQPASFFQNIGPLKAAIAGGILGAVLGGWTLVSRPPLRTVVLPSVAPPASPPCPNGYARASELDARSAVEGTRVRWLARCDPRSSRAALSESLELFWSNELHLDRRTQSDALADFTRAVLRGGTLTLDPVRPIADVRIEGLPVTALEVDGTYRLPPLSIRVWALPVGASTLQVTLVTPRDRLQATTTSARAAIDRTEGLRAYDTTATATRGWHVRAECPNGFTDATQVNGGPAPMTFVGRYCLSPDDHGGTELTFAELPLRIDQPAFVRHLLELSATTVSTVGMVTGAGFGPTETFNVNGIDGSTALMDVTPPPAPVRMYGYLAPAGNGSVYALSTSMRNHSEGARATLESWLSDSAHLRAYESSIIADYKRTQNVKMVLGPTVITAVLAAAASRLLCKRA